MITKQEVMDFSREFGLEAKTVEKDYVLGWLLAGIANNPELINKWMFKGGTCLKKCYFETYRFSEDLDYTLIDEKHIDEKFLVETFKQIASWIYDMVGIEIPIDAIRFEVYKNNAGKMSVEGSVYYIGPLQRKGSLTRIKLDLTVDEILVLPPVMREVHHPYSDNSQTKIQANCYSFSEVFAEKIRALSERARPRDLYDVIHLYRHANPGVESAPIYEVLKKKCEYKAIPVPTMEHLENHPKLNELKSEWKNMLGHQLPVLPPLDNFWQELPNVFAWLYGENGKPTYQAAPPPREKINSAWQPPSMIQAWHMQTPLELIRYAGANHLCVELTYDNSKQLIEPYDLKQRQEGNLLLIAIEHDSGQWRSYQTDCIQQINITQTPFVPRYTMLLTPFSG